MINNLYYYSYCIYSKIRGMINYNIPSFFSPSLNEVYPNIFVGNLASIYDTKVLEDNQIKNIVSAVAGIESPYPDKYNYLVLDLIDSEYEEILEKFEESNKFIDNCLENNQKVLVHCICGVSRSSTLVTAYLISKGLGKPEEIIEKLKEKRSIINPIDNFRIQLNLFYNKLNPIVMVN